MLSTNEITKSALKELDIRGYDVWRQNQVPVKGRTFIGRKGLSDIIGFAKDGRFVLCEVKGKGDKLKPDQVELLNNATKAGCVTMLATLDDAGRFILKHYQIQ